MYNDLLVSVILCILFTCIITLMIIMLTCLDIPEDNISFQDILSILDECFISFVKWCCCMRRRDRVTPNINPIDPPRTVIPPVDIILNPLDDITLGIECMSPEPETKEESSFT